MLLKTTPNAEDARVVAEWSGDFETLGPVERFFLDVCQRVPNYGARIECAHFRHKFSDHVLELRERVREVETATAQVRDSRGLRALLELALALGNALNSGTPRGGAYGFHIDGLLKLPTIKSLDGKETLLDYIVMLADRAVATADIAANAVDVAPPSLSIAHPASSPHPPKFAVSSAASSAEDGTHAHPLPSHDDTSAFLLRAPAAAAAGHSRDVVALRSALDLGSELSALDAAARCSFGHLRTEIAQLESGVAQARDQLEARRPAYEERLAKLATHVVLRRVTDSFVRKVAAAAQQARLVHTASAPMTDIVVVNYDEDDDKEEDCDDDNDKGGNVDKNDDEEPDLFVEKFAPFVKEATSELQALRSNIDACADGFAQLVRLLGGASAVDGPDSSGGGAGGRGGGGTSADGGSTATDDGPEQLFGPRGLGGFVMALAKARERNERRRQIAEGNARRKVDAEARTKASALRRQSALQPDATATAASTATTLSARTSGRDFASADPATAQATDPLFLPKQSFRGRHSSALQPAAAHGSVGRSAQSPPPDATATKRTLDKFMMKFVTAMSTATTPAENSGARGAQTGGLGFASADPATTQTPPPDGTATKQNSTCS